MKHSIEIHENNTNETGTYKIWFKCFGKNHFRICSENFTDSLLSLRQKEDFFMGKYKFKIDDYDFSLLTNTPYDKIIYQHGELANPDLSYFIFLAK